MNLSFSLTPARITRFLLKIIGCLLIANLFGLYLKWKLGHESAFGFVPLFDFDQEYNIPSMYSTVTILASAGLLWVIAKDKNTKALRQTRYWKALCYIFIFLSLDELASIHNELGQIVEVLFKNIRFIRNEEVMSKSRFWVFVYAPLLVVFFLYFIRFYMKLPKQTRLSFLIAGIIYVGGAIGVELLGDRYMFHHDKPDIYYGFIYTVEELLEMLGIVLFIRALVNYIAKYASKKDITIHMNMAQRNGNTEQPSHHPSIINLETTELTSSNGIS